MNTKGKKALIGAGIITTLALNTMFVWSYPGIKEITAMFKPDLKVSLNGVEKSLKNEDGTQMSPILYGDRTYLPVRALSNLLGIGINYNSAASTVELTSQEKSKIHTLGVKMPNVSDEMNNSTYWINKLQNPDAVVLDNKGIDAFNNKITQLKETKVYDLKSYPDSISRDGIAAYISELPIPDDERFIGNKKVEPSYYDNIRKNMNLQGLRDNNNLSYGFTVRRTDLRTLPVKDPSYTDANDFEFDYFQETALEAAEPIILLHKTLDNSYYFIQSRNYRGWISSNDIALTKNKGEWLSYQEEKDFLVVTANKIILPPNPYNPALSGLVLGMGCKLPVYTTAVQPQVVDGMSSAGSFVVKVPARDDSGMFKTCDVLIPSSSDISTGFLPYTQANVIKQAFKMLGDRYGWGGLFGSHDCSSFVCDIYKTFGIILPRNTGEQEVSAGTTLKFSTQSYEERATALTGAKAGSILYMVNHEMLYLGTDGKHQYVIQSVYAHGDKNKPKAGGGFEKAIINAIVVSDLDLAKRNTGKTFLESLTSFKTIE